MEKVDIQPEKIFNVSALNRMIQLTIARQIPALWVSGEVSNFTRASSGHWYFSLKDQQAQIRCVMFRMRNQQLDWVPEAGQKIDVFASINLYEPRGDLQLQVDLLRRAGTGILFEAFEALKQKLLLEGLFDEQRKRPIAALPARVGIITSLQGAALQDILSTLQRIMPALPITIYPCMVQGQTAADQIVQALQQAGQHRTCTTLLLCRGGGSLEDLWPFNEERVARAIAASPIPVIGGVGHETDITIADFVADLRAATPTAAANLCCTHQDQLRQRLDECFSRIRQYTNQQMRQHEQSTDWLKARLVHPGKRLQAQQATLEQWRTRWHMAEKNLLWQKQQRLNQRQHTLHYLRPSGNVQTAQLTNLQRRLTYAIQHQLANAQQRVNNLSDHTRHLNPLAVLERGYTLTTDTQGNIIHDAIQLHPGDELLLRFARGQASVITSRTIDGND